MWATSVLDFYKFRERTSMNFSARMSATDESKKEDSLLPSCRPMDWLSLNVPQKPHMPS